ncbi:MAG: DUF2269 family protein [Chloroflexi bacterium]|nr:DUF2269 family protein [Chloroflexota bacterium]
MDDTFKLLLFLHVAVVILALGPTFAFPFLEGIANRKGVAATRFAHQFEARLETIWIRPGAVLIFLLGLGLIFKDDALREDMPVWLTVATVWFIVTFLTAVFVQGRNIQQGLKALEGVRDDAPLPEAYTAVAKRMQIVGGLLGLSVIGIAFLMIWKPGE